MSKKFMLFQSLLVLYLKIILKLLKMYTVDTKNKGGGGKSVIPLLEVLRLRGVLQHSFKIVQCYLYVASWDGGFNNLVL